MGQRTNIIIVSENKRSELNDNKGKVRVQVYHDQWGIGRKSFLNLINVFNYAYNLPYGKDALSVELNTPNISKEYDFHYDKGVLVNHEEDEDDPKGPELKTFYTSKGIADFIRRYCDNNNGAIVIYVTTEGERYSDGTNLKVGWILGWEDCAFYRTYEGDTPVIRSKGDDDYGYSEEEFKKYFGYTQKFGVPGDLFLSADEYAGININRTYSDEDFMKVVKGYMEYFDIDDLGIPDEDGPDKVVPVPTYEG